MNVRMLLSLALSCAVLLFCPSLQAQDLKLESGNKLKVIPVGNYLEVIVLGGKGIKCDDCYFTQYSGKLIESDGEKILLDLISFITKEKCNGYEMVHEEYFSENSELRSVPNASIHSIRDLERSRKAQKDIRSKNALGAISLTSGLTTGLASIAVKDKVDRAKVLLIASAELVFGILALVSGNKKNYFLTDMGKDKRIWTIVN